jgi:hypothetical protein
MVMKRKSQTESAAQSLKGTTQCSRFELALRDKITSRLPWLEGAQQLLRRFYSQGNLEALVNNWSYSHSVPALAYVYVEDVTFRSDTGRLSAGRPLLSTDNHQRRTFHE